MSSSGSDISGALNTDEKLVFLANTLAALSSAIAAIALALRLSKQGKLMRFMKNDEVESIVPQTKGGSARDYWGL